MRAALEPPVKYRQYANHGSMSITSQDHRSLIRPFAQVPGIFRISHKEAESRVEDKNDAIKKSQIQPNPIVTRENLYSDSGTSTMRLQRVELNSRFRNKVIMKGSFVSRFSDYEETSRMPRTLTVQSTR